MKLSILTIVSIFFHLLTLGNAKEDSLRIQEDVYDPMNHEVLTRRLQSDPTESPSPTMSPVPSAAPSSASSASPSVSLVPTIAETWLIEKWFSDTTLGGAITDIIDFFTGDIIDFFTGDIIDFFTGLFS